jgi:predicted nucleotidyltransferase
MHVLLEGVVGSTAYGLAGPDSDVDRLGVFAAPTAAFHGLAMPAESHVTTKPDSTLHEARKYAALSLKCNPGVTELMWLPGYIVTSPLGERLVGIRGAFLSAPAVMGAYLGYARDQLKKLIGRGDGRFDSDIPERRSLKNAVHVARLAEQGEHLYATGVVAVRLPDPDKTRAVGRFLLENPDRGLVMLQAAEERMKHAGSPLPDKPDTARVEAWLHAVRAEFYTNPKETP